VYFKVSAYKLDSVWIRRVDPDPKGYITTSPLEKAEFAAEGVDEKGNQVTVAPQWKMIPATAGILANGIFRPVDNYMGRVQFTITAGNIIGEYFDQGAKKSGLSVHYLMTSKGDTVSNGAGCQVLLPANIISANRTAELSLEIPVLKNQIYKSTTLDSTMGDSMTGTFNVMGDIYDITDVDSAIAFQSGVTDSITIALSIPNEYQKDAAGSVQRYYIAQWRPAKEDWLPLRKSTVASDGSVLYVKTTHFSRYAIVRRSGGLGAGVEIKPNPFSPYVRPVAEHGILAQQGALITVSAQTSGYSINLDIYNIVGDKVWSVVLQKAGMETKVWWDGKTLTRTVALDEKAHKLPDGSYKVSGDSMCRNGRYFLVVSVSDNQKIKRYMKNLVLFK
jgi:hypothetical protein